MKQVFRLVHPTARANAERAVREARDGMVVVVQEETRTLEQNAAIHGICTDLARSGLEWAGRPRTAIEWKVLLVSGHAAATGRGAEVVEGLEGELVSLRESTAQMSVSRGSSLIEYATAFAAHHGVALGARR